jgi:tRNA 2-thiocytidine biosynthesis protein TtcA
MNDMTPMTQDEAETGGHPVFANAPSSVEFKKLRKRLVRHVREAIDKFNMVERSSSGKGERPKWLIGISGGKDSYGLLAILLDLQWRGLLPVDLLACNLDQGQPNFPKHILPEYFESIGVSHRIEYRDTHSIINLSSKSLILIDKYFFPFAFTVKEPVKRGGF